LSICKAIVERLGGQIGFVTQPHQETTFYFDLPEWRPEGPQLVTAPASPDAPRILVCEDDRDIAALLVFILTQGGYRAETAYDAAQTKALLASNHYAAMILDVLLPDQNGLALLQELRTQEMTRRLPIIVVSVMAPEGRHELEGEAVCVVDWLQKPIDDQRLLAALSQAVNGYSTRRQPRILYIEDDAATQQVVSLLLKDVAQVVPVIGLQAAKQHLAREHFDLAILDLGLPDGVGWELLPHLRDQGGGPIPVVVFSAAEPCAEMARQVAASLVKTRVSTQVLYETVQWVLRHQRWGHTSLSAHSGQTQEVLL
jgi:DNA-binding response OmpR family regulator